MCVDTELTFQAPEFDDDVLRNVFTRSYAVRWSRAVVVDLQQVSRVHHWEPLVVSFSAVPMRGGAVRTRLPLAAAVAALDRIVVDS